MRVTPPPSLTHSLTYRLRVSRHLAPPRQVQFLKWKNPSFDNASVALYHDYEQTEPGDCGKGVVCGEYLWGAYVR